MGYGYNAVRGTYCDWQDIRSQVLNRAMLLEMQDKTGDAILRTDQTQIESLDAAFEYSLRDYVVNMDLNLTKEVDLGIYKEGMRKRQFFIEDGVQERYFYTLNEKIILAHQYVGWANVRELYPRNKNMLTESFRNAIEHLMESDASDIAAVDSFINVWGTHVVVEAWLGGAIHVDLMNDMWRWTALSKDSAWTTKEFLGIVASTDERRHNSNEYRWTEHSRINILARGGNQETLTGLLGEHRFDGSRSFSTEGIDIWRASLNYDPDDEPNSNAELVDMKVMPIWEIAALVSNKDTGTWQQASRTDSADEPMIVNILSGGRYVATVCHETIDGRDLWVCYPIYEGRVKQACGLGVDSSNKVYQVRWLDGVAKLTPVNNVTAGEYFYINGGGVTVKAQEGIDYPDYQALPYFELSGGVRPDGTYAATAYSVSKNGEDFLLLAPDGLTDIVGFTNSKLWSGDKRIYQRNDNYVYIYNQNEIK